MFLFKNKQYPPPSDQPPHFMSYQQWYNMMQIPPQHQAPPQPHPGSQMRHTGFLPMSPRNSPSTLVSRQVTGRPSRKPTFASGLAWSCLVDLHALVLECCFHLIARYPFVFLLLNYFLALDRLTKRLIVGLAALSAQRSRLSRAQLETSGEIRKMCKTSGIRP